MSGWFLPIALHLQHCPSEAFKPASSLSTLPASYILTALETCSLHTFLGLISLSWFPAVEFFPLSLLLWFHPTLGLLGVCCPNCASSGPTVHPGYLKNSASWLSCALRKYFLGFVEQQSEIQSIVKEVWLSWGMNSDLHVSAQYLDYVIISTASSQIHLWKLNHGVKLHFSSLFSRLCL